MLLRVKRLVMTWRVMLTLQHRSGRTIPVRDSVRFLPDSLLLEKIIYFHLAFMRPSLLFSLVTHNIIPMPMT